MMILLSCTAVPNDLDSGGAPRSRALVDALMEAFSAAALWNDWGIDSQVKVWGQYIDVIETHYGHHSHLQTSSPVPTFAYCWHPTSFIN